MRRRAPRSPAKAASGAAQAEPKSKAARSEAAAAADPPPPQAEPVPTPFPVVGVGASAGGVEAFSQLLHGLPDDTGMAFVLAQHLDPTHPSMLAELLSRASTMPVAVGKNDMLVEPNRVYVIPPKSSMAISQGRLVLTPPPERRGPPMPIDYFLRSLAREQRSRAIGVILSGTSTDGSLGLEAIKGEGGITFAQDERTARYDGMPRSAIATGCVDFVLSPEGIARELARIGRHPYVAAPEAAKAEELALVETDDFGKVLAILRNTKGVDFRLYRKSTVKRRITRRMALHHIDRLENYVRFLQENRGEIQALYQEILIKVTGFFRDPEAFELLKTKVFPRVVSNRSADTPIRIWVPGCSTGEEAYSVAMCLLEFLGESASNIPVQIFATDISEDTLEKARSGLYLENIAADISPERLRRFFTKTETGCQVSKTVRDLCVFAKQNLIKDPPFSRLDLISCRNVLIYLEPVLQKKVIPMFHYCLRHSGFLLLGASETVGPFADLFSMIDRHCKLYAKRAEISHPLVDFTRGEHLGHEEILPRKPGRIAEEGWTDQDLIREADRLVLTRVAPAGVVVDEQMEVIQFRGRTSPYLEPAPGRASLNLLKLAREGLVPELRAAIQRARDTGESVKRKGLMVRANEHWREVDIHVAPVRVAGREPHFLVLFQEGRPAAPAASGEPSAAAGKASKKGASAVRQVSLLKRELASTREYLQSVMEEHEATTEALQSANEEILSSNEQLQSINEEMETAKEELQSTNEKLTTVNEELQNRNAELTHTNNDLNNLIASVNVALVMLGGDLKIRRFTPVAGKSLNLIPTDVGRPITDIRLGINLPNLESLVLGVLDSLTACESEVQAGDGPWYSVSIRPYRTADNRIDGAVLILTDIDQLKRNPEAIREAHDYAEAAFEFVHEPLAVLNTELRFRIASAAFCRLAQTSRQETEGQLLYELGAGLWNLPGLRARLEEVVCKDALLSDYPLQQELPGLGLRTLWVSARGISRTGDRPTAILLRVAEAAAPVTQRAGAGAGV